MVAKLGNPRRDPVTCCVRLDPRCPWLCWMDGPTGADGGHSFAPGAGAAIPEGHGRRARDAAHRHPPADGRYSRGQRGEEG